MNWTREPPTKPGRYWAMLWSGPVIAQAVDDPNGGVEFLLCGGSDPFQASDFRAWSSAPIPLPEGEVPE